MYIGRFVVVGPGLGGYRVSSRSFPDREIVDRDCRFTVQPTESAPPTDNPYVSYNCLRFVRGTDSVASPQNADTAVIGNGSHVDPIAEKIALGYPDRDSLVSVLLTMDYEHDEYNTPRIAGVISANLAFIGIVRHDGLVVESVTEPTIVATYEMTIPEPIELEENTAESIAQTVFSADFDHPVCSIGVTRGNTGFETAIVNK